MTHIGNVVNELREALRKQRLAEDELAIVATNLDNVIIKTHKEIAEKLDEILFYLKEKH